MSDFGERLKHLINESHFKTSKGFGEKAGYSQVAISNLLKGKSKPSYEFIVTLITLIPEVDIKWLLTGENENYASLKKKIRELSDALQNYEDRMDAIVKPYSNLMNPQLSLEFKNDFNRKKMKNQYEKVSD